MRITDFPNSSVRTSLYASSKSVQRKASNPQVKDQFILEPKQGGPSKFAAVLVSDTHLDNHVNGGNKGQSDNPHRIHFRKWLTNDLINKEVKNSQDEQEVTLIILGDGIDFNASWEADFMPYDIKANISDMTLAQKTIDEIVLNNSSIFAELKRFLQSSENTNIVYVIGNHDNILLLDESFTELLSQVILPNNLSNERNQRLIFTKTVEVPTLGLYAEHGHGFDSLNYSPIGGRTTGDWLTIKANILFSRIVEKVKRANLPCEVKDKIVDKIRQIENIRPKTVIPVYLRFLAEHYYEKYKRKDQRVAKEAKELILSFSKDIGEILGDMSFLRRFKDIGLFPKLLLNRILSSKTIQGLIARIVSTIEYYSTDSNKAQIREAINLGELKGIEFFAGGHTHNLEHKRERVHYFNLGAWKPVIPAYRKGYDWIFPESILPASSLRLETNLAARKQRRRVQYEFDTFEEGKVKLK